MVESEFEGSSEASGDDGGACAREETEEDMFCGRRESGVES